MNRTFGRRILQLLIGAMGSMVGIGVCVSGAGCQQMAAADKAVSAIKAAQAITTQPSETAQAAVQSAKNTAQLAIQTAGNAIEALPGGQLALNAIPQSILDALNNIVSLNNLSWGKPKSILYADGRYIFVYPSTWGPFEGTRPRVIIIDSMTQVARLERLQKLGY